MNACPLYNTLCASKSNTGLRKRALRQLQEANLRTRQEPWPGWYSPTEQLYTSRCHQELPVTLEVQPPHQLGRYKPTGCHTSCQPAAHISICGGMYKYTPGRHTRGGPPVAPLSCRCGVTLAHIHSHSHGSTNRELCQASTTHTRAPTSSYSSCWRCHGATRVSLLVLGAMHSCHQPPPGVHMNWVISASVTHVTRTAAQQLNPCSTSCLSLSPSPSQPTTCSCPTCSHATWSLFTI